VRMAVEMNEGARLGHGNPFQLPESVCGNSGATAETSRLSRALSVANVAITRHSAPEEHGWASSTVAPHGRGWCDHL